MTVQFSDMKNFSFTFGFIFAFLDYHLSVKAYNFLFISGKHSVVGAKFVCHANSSFMQVEELTRKSQLQEIELERTTRQLKEALAVAGEETAKCRAAKDVIKSLTAQVSSIFLFIFVQTICVFFQFKYFATGRHVSLNST